MLSRYSIIRLINTNSIGNIIRNSYKSSISLDNLYPKTQLNPLEKPSLNFELTDQKFSGFIPISKYLYFINPNKSKNCTNFDNTFQSR